MVNEGFVLLSFPNSKRLNEVRRSHANQPTDGCYRLIGNRRLIQLASKQALCGFFKVANQNREPFRQLERLMAVLPPLTVHLAQALGCPLPPCLTAATRTRKDPRQERTSCRLYESAQEEGSDNLALWGERRCLRESLIVTA